jgi:hypothetical protein
MSMHTQGDLDRMLTRRPLTAMRDQLDSLLDGKWRSCRRHEARPQRGVASRKRAGGDDAARCAGLPRARPRSPARTRAAST